MKSAKVELSPDIKNELKDSKDKKVASFHLSLLHSKIFHSFIISFIKKKLFNFLKFIKKLCTPQKSSDYQKLDLKNNERTEIFSTRIKTNC